MTYDPGPDIGWFQWFNLTGSTNPRVKSLRIYVSTVSPIRNPVYLVVPNDYSGIYNVTSGAMTTSRRYTGEAKFYALFVNITDPTYGFVGEKETFLVPRTVFFDTYLYSRLNKASNMTGWLTDSANQVKFSQNDSAGSGTAVLDGALSAELDLTEYTTMTDWLKKNASSGMADRYFRVDWE